MWCVNVCVRVPSGNKIAACAVLEALVCVEKLVIVVKQTVLSYLA